jgi:hypothetical protein
LSIEGVPGGKVSILGGHSVGHSEYIYMCPIPNGFRDRAISLYSSKSDISKYSRTVCQRLGKHVPAATDTNTTGTVFSVRSVPRCHKRDGLGQLVNCMNAQLKVGC